MIWKSTQTLSGVQQVLRVVWRRTRKVKDRWPLLQVNFIAIEVTGTPLTNVAVSERAAFYLVDNAHEAETRSGWSTAGNLYALQIDRSAVGSELIIQENVLPLPDVFACDGLDLLYTGVVGAIFDVVVGYNVLFTEDHEAWIRKKQRDCHDEA